MILDKQSMFDSKIQILEKSITNHSKDKLIQKKLAFLDEVSDSFHGIMSSIVKTT